MKKLNKRGPLSKISYFLFVSTPIHIIILLTSLLPNSSIANRIRGLLLRPFFKRCGKGVQIASGVLINNINKVSLGNNVYIAHNVWINGAGGLEINDNSIVGPYSVIATTQHVFIDNMVSNRESNVGNIVIGQGTWLASHVVVTQGVTIGDGVLIAAGSTVTKNISSFTMVGGVPAKFIKDMN
ncbi:acyltransferase [Rossellomorea aquimaris]|uniref:Acetyltransferase-like isoleucine patch superfamily enzyme n=1 Tax=Rossellomorea aquimaris TaxID=189382 RepID=A0A366EQR5_9BACI|nr:acyltransferase [Rossellomorea aquimaris]RBP04721.1 acetyltransferase-like isoleucine patch superfamily enzyme [Rossellomorea aquimaris]